MSKKLDRSDLESFPMPSKVIWAISEISVFLGEPFIVFSGSGVAWGVNELGGYLVYLNWSDTGCKVTFDSSIDAEWKPIYQIIGYCAYHGIGWEAP